MPLEKRVNGNSLCSQTERGDFDMCPVGGENLPSERRGAPKPGMMMRAGKILQRFQTKQNGFNETWIDDTILQFRANRLLRFRKSTSIHWSTFVAQKLRAEGDKISQNSTCVRNINAAVPDALPKSRCVSQRTERSARLVSIFSS